MPANGSASVRILARVATPTTVREDTSVINAVEPTPNRAPTSVMSATHTWCGMCVAEVTIDQIRVTSRDISPKRCYWGAPLFFCLGYQRVSSNREL